MALLTSSLPTWRSGTEGLTATSELGFTYTTGQMQLDSRAHGVTLFGEATATAGVGDDLDFFNQADDGPVGAIGAGPLPEGGADQLHGYPNQASATAGVGDDLDFFNQANDGPAGAPGAGPLPEGGADQLHGYPNQAYGADPVVDHSAPVAAPTPGTDSATGSATGYTAAEGYPDASTHQHGDTTATAQQNPDASLADPQNPGLDTVWLASLDREALGEWNSYYAAVQAGNVMDSVTQAQWAAYFAHLQHQFQYQQYYYLQQQQLAGGGYESSALGAGQADYSATQLQQADGSVFDASASDQPATKALTSTLSVGGWGSATEGNTNLYGLQQQQQQQGYGNTAESSVNLYSAPQPAYGVPGSAETGSGAGATNLYSQGQQYGAAASTSASNPYIPEQALPATSTAEPSSTNMYGTGAGTAGATSTNMYAADTAGGGLYGHSEPFNPMGGMGGDATAGGAMYSGADALTSGGMFAPSTSTASNMYVQNNAALAARGCPNGRPPCALVAFGFGGRALWLKPLSDEANDSQPVAGRALWLKPLSDEANDSQPVAGLGALTHSATSIVSLVAPLVLSSVSELPELLSIGTLGKGGEKGKKGTKASESWISKASSVVGSRRPSDSSNSSHLDLSDLATLATSGFGAGAHSKDPLKKVLLSFPGPLNSSTSKEKVLKYITERAKAVESEDAMICQPTETARLFWDVLHVAVKHGGSFFQTLAPQKKGSKETGPEVELLKILAPPSSPTPLPQTPPTGTPSPTTTPPSAPTSTNPGWAAATSPSAPSTSSAPAPVPGMGGFTPTQPHQPGVHSHQPNSTLPGFTPTQAHQPHQACEVLVPRGLASGSEEEMERSAREVQKLVMQGKRAAALKLAVDSKLWAVALLIAPSCGERAFPETMAAFAQASISPGAPLRTFALMSASRPDLIYSDSFDAAPSATSATTKGFLSRLGSTFSPTKALQGAGASPRSAILAAQLCYALAGIGPGFIHPGEMMPPHDTSTSTSTSPEPQACQFNLLGADHRESPRNYATVLAVQRTEILEWAWGLASTATPSQSGGPAAAGGAAKGGGAVDNVASALLPLQPYKLLYAYTLVEYGRIAEAMGYCQALENVLKHHPSGGRAFPPSFQLLSQELITLKDRLAHLAEAQNITTNRPGKSFGNKIGKFLDGTLNKLLWGGDPTPLPPGQSPPGQANAQGGGVGGPAQGAGGPAGNGMGGSGQGPYVAFGGPGVTSVGLGPLSSESGAGLAGPGSEGMGPDMGSADRALAGSRRMSFYSGLAPLAPPFAPSLTSSSVTTAITIATSCRSSHSRLPPPAPPFAPTLTPSSATTATTWRSSHSGLAPPAPPFAPSLTPSSATTSTTNRSSYSGLAPSAPSFAPPLTPSSATTTATTCRSSYSGLPPPAPPFAPTLTPSSATTATTCGSSHSGLATPAPSFAPTLTPSSATTATTCRSSHSGFAPPAPPFAPSLTPSASSNSLTSVYEATAHKRSQSHGDVFSQASHLQPPYPGSTMGAVPPGLPGGLSPSPLGGGEGMGAPARTQSTGHTGLPRVGSNSRLAHQSVQEGGFITGGADKDKDGGAGAGGEKERERKKNSLGEENKFYFNKELKRWVMEGEEHLAAADAAPPPPPTSFGASPMGDAASTPAPPTPSDAAPSGPPSAPSSQTGAPPTAPSMQRGRGVRSRYVDTFNPSPATTSAAASSLLLSSATSALVPPAASSTPAGGSFFMPPGVAPSSTGGGSIYSSQSQQGRQAGAAAEANGGGSIYSSQGQQCRQAGAAAEANGAFPSEASRTFLSTVEGSDLSSAYGQASQSTFPSATTSATSSAPEPTPYSAYTHHEPRAASQSTFPSALTSTSAPTIASNPHHVHYTTQPSSAAHQPHQEQHPGAPNSFQPPPASATSATSHAQGEPSTALPDADVAASIGAASPYQTFPDQPQGGSYTGSAPYQAFQDQSVGSSAPYQVFQGQQPGGTAPYQAFQDQSVGSSAPYQVFQGQQPGGTAPYQAFQDQSVGSSAPYQVFQGQQPGGTAPYQAFRDQSLGSSAPYQASQDPQGSAPPYSGFRDPQGGTSPYQAMQDPPAPSQPSSSQAKPPPAVATSAVPYYYEDPYSAISPRSATGGNGFGSRTGVPPQAVTAYSSLSPEGGDTTMTSATASASVPGTISGMPVQSSGYNLEQSSSQAVMLAENLLGDPPGLSLAQGNLGTSRPIEAKPISTAMEAAPSASGPLSARSQAGPKGPSSTGGAQNSRLGSLIGRPSGSYGVSSIVGRPGANIGRPHPSVKQQVFGNAEEAIGGGADDDEAGMKEIAL
eukprot:gene26683-4258_t